MYLVRFTEVPSCSNFTRSHVTYNMNTNDHAFLKLKARIAAHWDGQRMKKIVRSDLVMCSPVRLMIVFRITVLRGRRIPERDV